MKKVLVAYVPVLHQGYWQLFSAFPDVSELYLLSGEQAQEFTPHHKEIRALSEDKIISAIKSWQRFASVEILSADKIQELNSEKAILVIPDELVTTGFAEKYLPECPTEKSSIFLRWDKKSMKAPHEPNPDEVISSDEFDRKMIALATEEGNKSSDWWRQVGAVLVKDDQAILVVHNTHLPDEQQPYAESDPRAHSHKGEDIELTTAIHAEAKLIAEAARKGIALEGTDLYLTDFPCPVCAKSIASAGIKTVYYQKGYSMLDGERVLKSAGVKLVKVDIDLFEELLELADKSYVESIRKARKEYEQGDVFSLDEVFPDV
ncbi:MAG: hypothetical protein COY80_01745 [Candidatus Pacebacteria bacterium CG_4_10_14_0_8_um_filter_42_14]|nr:MAG: hypothetical protein COY80_01745 [Candidatus Pacebacteria bacterium CG_4_10_14_0_8_um_filter_42_14]